MQPATTAPRLRLVSQWHFPMNDEVQPSADSPWQSLRLGLGAVLLILGGLGLFLLDSSTHTSTAQSAMAVIGYHP